MKYNQIEINNNEFSIKCRRAPIFVIAILFILLLISITGPLFGIYWAVKSGGGIKFINILLLFLFGLISFYFIRLILWNLFGTEKFRIVKNKLEYTADYKLFKMNTQIIELNGIQVDILDSGDDKNGYITFFNQDRELRSVIKTEKKELQGLKDKLKHRFSKKIKL